MGRTEEQSIPDSFRSYPAGWKLALILMALCLGTLLVAIDTTIIGTAIPVISTAFQALDDVGWYGSAYLLTLTAFQPSFAKVYKLYNVKFTYLISIALFEVGSILCATAPKSPVFILGRAVAGLGAAGLFQGALLIVAMTTPLPKRPLYLGLVAGVFGLASGFGPVLGGALTEHASWRWCFWINIPIGGVVCVLVIMFLKLDGAGNNEDSRKLPSKTKLYHMDPLGTVTLVAAACCLFLALRWGGATLSWRSSTVIGLLVGSSLLTVAFGFLQWKLGERATIVIRILKQRSVLMGLTFSFFLQMTTYTQGYYVPLYFQAVQGVSATISGAQYLSRAVPTVAAAVITGAIVSKTGSYVPFMILGEFICAIGAGLLIRLGLGTSAAEWASYLVITALGQGMAMQMPYTALQIALSESDIPLGNGITVFFSQLGGAIGVSVAQNIFINGLTREVSTRTQAVSSQAVLRAGPANLRTLSSSTEVLHILREAYAKGIRNTFYFSLATACVALPFAFGMEWRNVKKVAEQRTREELDNHNADVGKTKSIK